jgi:hypothetical protein
MTKRQVALIRFIRQRRTYTVKELSDLLGVHLQTVHQWRKEGLTALEGSQPLLLQGGVVKEFLKSRVSGRKKTLAPDEFFCMGCRLPRRSIPAYRTSEPTGRKIGHGKEQVLLRGRCERCNCQLVRFAVRPATDGADSLTQPDKPRGDDNGLHVPLTTLTRKD